jgi:hypothetical protein
MSPQARRYMKADQDTPQLDILNEFSLDETVALHNSRIKKVMRRSRSRTSVLVFIFDMAIYSFHTMALSYPDKGQEEVMIGYYILRQKENDSGQDRNDGVEQTRGAVYVASQQAPRELQKEPFEQQELDITNPLESFGACLLIKDDNHLLIEWLAFHYHTLPLRDLTVLIDSGGKTSPMGLLDRWKGRMNIQVWNDTFFQGRYYRNYFGVVFVVPVVPDVSSGTTFRIPILSKIHDLPSSSVILSFHSLSALVVTHYS